MNEHWIESRHVPARRVDVLLPVGYGEDPARRYPVLYMHDGQNLFDADKSFIGVPWGVGHTMYCLIRDQMIQPAIVVGVWHTRERWREYTPEKPFLRMTSPEVRDAWVRERGEPCGDAYLRFLVQDLKPFIDREYLTQPDRASTMIMGASLGAMISLAALIEYPEVFGAAASISCHWPAADAVLLRYLAEGMPRAGRHRVFYGYGTETLDAGYAPYQDRVDAIMREAGYRHGADWVTRRNQGDEHSERAWSQRLHQQLEFFFA